MKRYAKRMTINAWVWLLGPLILVVGGLIASWTGPVEDGVDLEPLAQHEASLVAAPTDD